MGSKVSSNQHLVDAETEELDRKLRRSLSMSSATDSGEGHSGDANAGDMFDGHSPTKTSNVHIENDCDGGEEAAFDINENFDFDSDRVTIDSDVMTMESICDGFDVVEIGDHRDVGIGKRHRPSKASLLAGEQAPETDTMTEKLRAMKVGSNTPNGNIGHSASPQLHRAHNSAIQPVVYKMDYPNRGRAVIVNQTHFEPITGMSNREGTDPDMEGLERVFDHLGFQVELYCDLSVSEFKRLLHRVSSDDFRNDDCFAFIAMSHGEEGVMYCTDGTVHLDEVAHRFKGNMCPALIGKPKLFLFQACRGSQMDHGVSKRAVEGDDEPDAAIEQKMFYTIPVEADFLMAYSSTPGYYSWRSLREGSWFIQAVITIFEKYGTCMDMVQMMTRVNRTVAYRYESTSSDERYNGRKQMPCFVSTLTKELYFIPKK